MTGALPNHRTNVRHLLANVMLLKRHLLTLAAFLCLALVSAGCGGDTQPASADTEIELARTRTQLAATELLITRQVQPTSTRTLAIDTNTPLPSPTSAPPSTVRPPEPPTATPPPPAQTSAPSPTPARDPRCNVYRTPDGVPYPECVSIPATATASVAAEVEAFAGLDKCEMFWGNWLDWEVALRWTARLGSSGIDGIQAQLGWFESVSGQCVGQGSRAGQVRDAFNSCAVSHSRLLGWQLNQDTSLTFGGRPSRPATEAIREYQAFNRLAGC